MIKTRWYDVSDLWIVNAYMWLLLWDFFCCVCAAYKYMSQTHGSVGIYQAGFQWVSRELNERGIKDKEE